jgi:transcriptional regulator with XRE-family HTH domain
MNRLREERLKKGLSLEQVGKDMNLATNTISRYETGKREPKLETWNKLAEYFNVPTSYLMGTDNLKFPTKQEAIDFIHKIMKAQNIKLEDI